jgi:hypothetical protein
VESSQSGKSTRERVSSDLQKALEDLRKAGENATGDVRSGIESAVTRIRDASGAASSGDLRGQLDSFRSWLQGATVDILDDIEKEVRKRRQQLAGQGASKSGSSTKSGGSTKSGSSSKSSGSKSGSGSKSRS